MRLRARGDDVEGQIGVAVFFVQFHHTVVKAQRVVHLGFVIGKASGMQRAGGQRQRCCKAQICEMFFHETTMLRAVPLFNNTSPTTPRQRWFFDNIAMLLPVFPPPPEGWGIPCHVAHALTETP